MHGVHAPALDATGFRIVPQVVSEDVCRALREVCTQLLGEGRPGSREGLAHPVVAALARSPAVRALVAPVLGRDAFAYRATLFDKSPAANWLVAWHQDLVVPLRERRDVAGYGPWSHKHGVWFAQPPSAVLRRLLAVRIDLDGSHADNGALRVLAGSHRDGVLSPAGVLAATRALPAITCEVPAGGALLMRPLLVHASSRSRDARHRRVVHLEYAATPLAHGLAFAASA